MNKIAIALSLSAACRSSRKRREKTGSCHSTSGEWADKSDWRRRQDPLRTCSTGISSQGLGQKPKLAAT